MHLSGKAELTIVVFNFVVPKLLKAFKFLVYIYRCKKVTSKFVAISKMQKSIADLEKLYNERKGANFVVPSKRRGQDKVIIDPCNQIRIWF